MPMVVMDPFPSPAARSEPAPTEPRRLLVQAVEKRLRSPAAGRRLERGSWRDEGDADGGFQVAILAMVLSHTDWTRDRHDRRRHQIQSLRATRGI
jgi:hypothetical protein